MRASRLSQQPQRAAPGQRQLLGGPGGGGQLIAGEASHGAT